MVCLPSLHLAFVLTLHEGGHRVQVYDSEAKFLFKFGREGRGDGELQYPYDVAVQLQTNRIIVADSLNQRGMSLPLLSGLSLFLDNGVSHEEQLDSYVSFKSY